MSQSYEKLERFLGIELNLGSLDLSTLDANNLELEKHLASLSQSLSTSRSKIEQFKSPELNAMLDKLDHANLEEITGIIKSIIDEKNASMKSFDEFLQKEQELISQFVDDGEA